MIVQPYLNFDGQCEEAIEFYQSVMGAKVELMMRCKDAPLEPGQKISPGSEDKILHAAFRVGESLLMGSDGYNKGKPDFKGFSLSLSATDEAHAKRLFDGLSRGGKVTMPLAATFYSPCFGMLEDKFGMGWMVIVQPKR
ncbi:MAG TPA: VOC family protein [Usitatibacter sp.]